jgi:hypothetical protein
VFSGESSSRPRSPLPRMAVSAMPEPVSGKEDNPKAKLSRSPQGTGAINAYLPHAELQVNSCNKTAVLSSFTNYDDACDHYSHTPSANPRWDVQYDKSTGWSSGANSASPEVGLNLGTNSASPEPGLGYLLPVNPTGGHSFNCGTHVFESWNKLGHDFGRTSTSPEPDSNLDIRNKNVPDVTIYYITDVLPRGFLPYSVSCQPLWHGPPPCQGARVRDRALGPSLGS